MNDTKPEKTWAELWDDLFVAIGKALRIDVVLDYLNPVCEAIIKWWEGL